MKHGVRGILLGWFISYLTWKQYVFYNGETSDLKHISGFSVADDTNIYFESDDLLDVEKTLNTELKKLYLWLNVNRLSLNVSKTNYIIFHPHNKPLNKHITIKISKVAITGKDHIKYLGVII